MSSYGGLKYFQEKIWGSEKLLENNMGAWKFCRKKYGGLKKSFNKLWGSEINSGKNMGFRNFFLKIWQYPVNQNVKVMGVWNIFTKKYGDLKNFQERRWGCEIVFGKIMGTRNIFWEKYGGAKHFLGKIWGCEIILGKIMGVRIFFLFFWKLIRPGTRN